MDLIIGQLFSPIRSDQTAALDLLDLKKFPISEEFVPGLLNGLKTLLKRPEVRIVSKILTIINTLLQFQPTFSPFLALIPDLIHLLKFEKYQVHSFLLKFVPEFLGKTGDLGFLPKMIVESGIFRKSEELKLATLRLSLDLCGLGIDLAGMRDSLLALAEDASPLVQNTAGKLLKKIELQECKGLKNLFLNENLVFSCIPEKLIEKLSKKLTWREKLPILESIKEIFLSLEEFSSFSAHFPEFLNILLDQLQDPNSKITQVCVEILQIFLLNPQIYTKREILKVLTPCLSKFSDTKISIRQTVHKLFRSLSRFYLKDVVFELEKGLVHGNWHVREESVMVLIVFMLTFPNDFNYLSLAEKIARLLDDQRTKIRLVSTEAIVVLGYIYGESCVIDTLSEIVDQNALSCLTDRFLVKTLPEVTEDYIILSKEVPSEVRMISSPYLLTGPIESHAISLSYQVKSETPTTAETYTKRQLRDSVFNKTTKSTSAIYKSTSFSVESMKTESIEINPIYIPYELLEKVQHPTEALQKSTLHTENWLEQFETINTLRKLAKHHPEVFISKVTLHSIIINLIKWGDSLRSILSKNALIGLKEMCECLGKVLDGEILDILKIFLKKTVDTNSFIADTAGFGLNALCNALNEQKILTHLLGLVDSFKNPLIKAKILDCFIKLVNRAKGSIVKMNDFGRLVSFVNESLTDGNPEVRTYAKQAYTVLIETIPNEQSLNLAGSSGMRFSIFRKVKDSVKKKTKPHSVSSISLAKQELRVTLPSLSKVKSKKLVYKSARDLKSTIINDEPEDFKKLSKLEQDIIDPDWKLRYDSITSSLDLLKTSFETLKLAQKIDSLMFIVQKGLKDSNLKVLIHSLTYLSKIVGFMKTEISRFLKIFMEPVVLSLGCSNTSIRDAAFDVCVLLGNHCSADEMVPLMVAEMMKTSPKGRAAVLNLVSGLVGGIRNRGYLEGDLLNLAYKFVDDSRVDIRNEACKILVFLYRSLGNVVLESVPTKKLHRVINVISNKID